jgi:2-oxo-hept-3-ene-1,7-dioate hydratase
MSLDPATLDDIARRLDEAERSRTPIRQLTRQYPDITIEDGYRVQRAWVALKKARGLKVFGHKIGLTSRAMQQAVGIAEPDYGVLFDDMPYEDGARIPHSRFIRPRVEVELAFVLARPLGGPEVSLYDVLDATAYVRPAIEIIDARIEMTDPQTRSTRKVMDTISDNAANAALVLGGRPVRPGDVDLRWVSALLFQNGVIEESGVAAAVLNHPANGVAWLARRLAPWGESLAAGETILSGSFTRPVFVEPGDTFHVDYGPLGSIACRFEAGSPAG